MFRTELAMKRFLFQEMQPITLIMVICFAPNKNN